MEAEEFFLTDLSAGKMPSSSEVIHLPPLPPLLTTGSYGLDRVDWVVWIVQTVDLSDN